MVTSEKVNGGYKKGVEARGQKKGIKCFCAEEIRKWMSTKKMQ